jgi:hypothetical protein
MDRRGRLPTLAGRQRAVGVAADMTCGVDAGSGTTACARIEPSSLTLPPARAPTIPSRARGESCRRSRAVGGQLCPHFDRAYRPAGYAVSRQACAPHSPRGSPARKPSREGRTCQAFARGDVAPQAWLARTAGLPRTPAPSRPLLETASPREVPDRFMRHNTMVRRYPDDIVPLTTRNAALGTANHGA